MIPILATILYLFGASGWIGFLAVSYVAGLTYASVLSQMDTTKRRTRSSL